jgi:hypothetical protein
MTAQTVARALEKRDTGLDKLMWSKARHLESILPEHVDVKAFLGTAWAALLASDKLMQNAIAKPDTLLIALFRCAAKGHQPGTEEYYLTPRDGGVLGIEGYRGIVERMYRSGAVAKVVVREVCVKDYFRFVEGEDDKPVHDFAARRGGSTGGDFFGQDGNPVRGDMVGVYAVAKLLSGDWSRPVLLSRNDVFAARAAGGWKPDDKYSPWNRLDAGPDHPEFQGRSMWLKGLALDTPIATPAGWTTMGALQPGDTVFDRDGQPSRVTAVSEVKHLPCYRVEFTSGPPIICDNEHLWVARIAKQAERVHPVSDLCAAKAAGKRVIVPVARPVDLPAASLPVDPWLLGFWLGDGNRTKPSVTCGRSEVAEVEAAIRSAGYQTCARQDPRSQAVDISISGGLAKQLAELGLLGDKHVPAIYLRGSAEQRLALLRGLMDADGTIWQRRGTSGRVRFFNTSGRLARAVAELARSLGEQVLEVEYDGRGYGKTVHVYQVSWTPSVMPFATAAKAPRTRLRVVPSYNHRVKTITPVDSVPTCCIAVDSPSRTFLAGSAMIPTHNTAARRLEPWVPTSAEYRREQLRASASAAVASGNGMPVLAAADAPEIHDAEVIEQGAVAELPNGNGAHAEPDGTRAAPDDDALPIEDPPDWPEPVKPGTGTPKGK